MKQALDQFWEVTRGVAYRSVRGFLARPVVSLIPMVMPLMFFATFLYYRDSKVSGMMY